MKKIFGSILIIFLICLFTACSASKDKKVDDINKMKTSESFEITLTSVKLVENNLNTDVKHDTLELGVKAKNISKKDADIGTGDFYILGQKNKKYTFTGNESNFGNVVKPGKELAGKGYYSIPESARGDDMVVIYKPFKSTEQIKWSISIPKNLVKVK